MIAMIKEDWVYQGLPLPESDRDFGNPETQKKFLKTLWHEVKQQTKSAITVIVDSKAGSDGTIQELMFIITHFDLKRSKVVKEPIGTIKLSLGGNGTWFVFHIVDRFLAETVDLTLKGLSDACQVAFSTTLVACEAPDGNPPLDPIDEITWRCKQDPDDCDYQFQYSSVHHRH